MGAAIPHLFLITTSLPCVLSPTFSASDIKTKVLTGSIQCIDEIIPDEEDEDEDEGGMQTRLKSNVSVEFIIGDGERAEGSGGGKTRKGC